jgi:hypothetical protein
VKNARQLKFYIASGLENGSNGVYARVKEIVERLGHVVTYDWSVHGAVWSEGVERIREVAIDEMCGVYEADVVLVVLPGGRGTHVELGMALAWNKPVILWSADGTQFTADPSTCAFYHFPPRPVYEVAYATTRRGNVHVPCVYAVTGPIESIALTIAGDIENLPEFSR